jgi:hypothetical protein
MSESHADQLKKRFEINPRLASRPDIVTCARFLKSLLSVGPEEKLSSGEWFISCIHRERMWKFAYGGSKAVYWFVPQEDNGRLIMDNQHREAFEGWGVSSFSELEHIAAALATEIHKPVTFIFPLFNQKDTERFLLQRGYTTLSYIGIPGGKPCSSLERTFAPLGEIHST